MFISRETKQNYLSILGSISSGDSLCILGELSRYSAMVLPALPLWLMLHLASISGVAHVNSQPDCTIYIFFLIAVAAAMGKAADSASIVALVTFIAEEGKAV